MVIVRIIKKFALILSKHQIFRICELIALMIIGGFMEVLSVSLVVPFVKTIIDAETIMADRRVASILELLHITSSRSFLFILALIMAVVYFVKNAYLIIQVTVQERFVQNNRFAIQKSIFHNFINRPYEYYLSAHTGDMIRIVTIDIYDAFNLLTALLSFFSEMIVAIVLSLTVFIISPILTTCLSGLLLITVLVLYAFSHKPIQRAGKRYQVALGAIYSTLIQSFQGIKEVKLMRKESFFEKQFDKDGKIMVKSAYINKMATILPRNMIEATAMCGIFIVVAVMIGRSNEIGSLIPIISGVAMASVRLLPCVNRISSTFSQLSYSEPALDKLVENLTTLKEEDYWKSDSEKQEDFSNRNTDKWFEKEVLAKDICYKYPTGTRDIFKKANIKIEKGQSVGIVGTSGAGKTTIVDIILGLLPPQSGTILVDGTDIEKNMEWWLSQIGYIPQSIFLLEGTIRENVAFGIDPEETDDKQVMKALEEASLTEYISTLPEGINTQIGERGIRLSGGQRQRIGIARALYKDPEILFFDEATSALDNETESAIMDSINHFHGTKTMVIIAHRLTTIEHCDVVYRVESGKIIRER